MPDIWIALAIDHLDHGTTKQPLRMKQNVSHPQPKSPTLEPENMDTGVEKLEHCWNAVTRFNHEIA
jgi:hypothetical protein